MRAGPQGGNSESSARNRISPEDGALSDEPPQLHIYSNEPHYDLSTAVHLVGVRPVVLWEWERQLGIPHHLRFDAGRGGSLHAYSERELVALIWLRRQVTRGEAPESAARRLLTAQQAGSLTSGPLPPQPPTAPPQSPAPRAAPFGWEGARSYTTRALVDEGLPAEGSVQPGGSSARLRAPAYASPPPDDARDPWARVSPAPLSPPYPLYADGERLRSGVRQTNPPRPATNPLGAAPGVSSGAANVAASASWNTRAPSSTPTASKTDLALVAPLLTRAFAAFDSAGANRLVSEALETASIEAICLNLIQPALNRIGDLWSRRQVTTAEEHFASNYVRSFLFSILYSTPERYDAPMTILGCPPRETHDIGALMLAVFWRRAGLRVVYLGADVAENDLLAQARARRPALIALSITSPSHVRQLSRIARAIATLATPTPLFAYGGTPFARNPQLQARVEGVYLGDDAATATWNARRMLGLEDV